MTVRLLGTGAAEGIPAFVSDSRVSNYAREHGGKDVRTRCGALIDGSVKIDLPPDTLGHIHRDRLDARDWTCLIFTHSHADHFAIEEIQYCLYPFSKLEYLCWTIYGNQHVCSLIAEKYPSWPLDVVTVRTFQPFTHEEYTITPIRANHQDDEESLNYIFQKNGKTLLYATDTGIWPDETWEFLSKFKLDGLVIECTEGLASTDYEGHLSAEEVRDVVSRLRKAGVVTDKTFVTTTHHSHNGEGTHSELEAALNPHGIKVGYDGMEFQI